jgi:hypothetical protein
MLSLQSELDSAGLQYQPCGVDAVVFSLPFRSPPHSSKPSTAAANATSSSAAATGSNGIDAIDSSDLALGDGLFAPSRSSSLQVLLRIKSDTAGESKITEPSALAQLHIEAELSHPVLARVYPFILEQSLWSTAPVRLPSARSLPLQDSSVQLQRGRAQDTVIFT